MVSRLERMNSSMMNDLMKDVMLSLSGVPPEQPTPSNKLISSDGRVQTIGGLQAADFLTLFTNKLLKDFGTKTWQEGETFIDALKRNLHESSYTNSNLNESLPPDTDKLLNSLDVQAILQRFEKIVLSGKLSSKNLTSGVATDNDESVQITSLGHCLAVYMSALSHRKHLADRIFTDTTTWIAKIFRYPADAGYFHYNLHEGLTEVTRLSIAERYPEYERSGYQVFQHSPPVIYLSAATDLCVGQNMCTQLGLPMSSLSIIPFDSSVSYSETMDVSFLRDQVASDVRNCKTPLLLLAYAGTPNLCQLDNLQELLQICDKYNIWLHLTGTDLALLCQLAVPMNLLRTRRCNSMTLNLPAWFKLPGLSCLTLYRNQSAKIRPTLSHKTVQSEDTDHHDDIEAREEELLNSEEENLQQEFTNHDSESVCLLSQPVPGKSGHSEDVGQIYPQRDDVMSLVASDLMIGNDVLSLVASDVSVESTSMLDQQLIACCNDVSSLVVHSKKARPTRLVNTVINDSNNVKVWSCEADYKSTTLTNTFASRSSSEMILQDCLPYWLALQHMGHDGLAARVTHCVKLVELLHTGLKKMPAIQIVRKSSRKQTKSLTVVNLIYKLVNSFIVREVMKPVVVFCYRSISFSAAVESTTMAATVEADPSQICLAVESINPELTSENSETPPTKDEIEEPIVAKQSETTVLMNCYRERLNTWLTDSLLSSIPLLKLSTVCIPDLGVCMRFSPLDCFHARDATPEDISRVINFIETKTKQLNLFFELHLQLLNVIEDHPNLRIVCDTTLDSVGSIMYVPDIYEGCETDRIESVSQREPTAEYINRLNRQLFKLLPAADKAVITLGSTTDDTDCIVLGKISTWNHLHTLLLHIDDAGRRAVEDWKALNEASQDVMIGIKKATMDMNENKHQQTQAGDTIRTIPLFGSIVKWLSPSSEHHHCTGRTFDLSSGKLEAT